MGRYYDGDIHGKFVFGIQSSLAADRFGVTGQDPGYVDYYFDESNLQGVKDELNNIVSKFGVHGFALATYFRLGYYDHSNKHHLSFPGYLAKAGYIDDPNNYFRDKVELLQDYHDYYLGYKIMKCIEETGQCSFTAEL